MDAERFNTLQKKASGFLGEGMRILRGGLKEAGRLINATADATKIHIEKEQRMIALHRDFHRLGVEIYRRLEGKTAGATLTLADETWELVERIKYAQKDIARYRDKLNHFTVVGEAPADAAEPVKNARGKAAPKEKAAVRGSVPRAPRRPKNSSKSSGRG